MFFSVLPMPRPMDEKMATLVKERTEADMTPAVVETTRPATVVVARPVWTILQPLAGLLGAFLVVLGSVAIIETGVDAWTEPTVTTWGFGHTPLLALAEIVLGLCLLASSASPGAARAALFGFGSVMAVFGAVTLLEPGVFEDLLGANRQAGVLYAATGGGAVFLAAVAPPAR